MSNKILLTGWCASPGKISWIDFNSDGKPDLVCNGNYGNHQVLLNNGGSLLSITGDITSQLTVRLTSNSVPIALSSWCNNPNRTSWIDFNNDGKLDLACNENDGTHQVLLNNGDALLSMTGDITSRLAAKLASNLAPVILLNWCTPPSKTSWIDFNNDGKQDLACNGNDGTHQVLLNNGDSLLSITGDIASKLSVKLTSNSVPVQLSGWCNDPTRTSWIDFNNDGKPDLACNGNGNEGTHKVLLNNGDSLLSVTGDITSQLAVRFSDNPTLTVLSGWCTESITTTTYDPYSGHHSRTTISPGKTSWVDFNNDGKLDLACHKKDGTHQVLLNNEDALLSMTGDVISQLAVKLADANDVSVLLKNNIDLLLLAKTGDVTNQPAAKDTPTFGIDANDVSVLPKNNIDSLLLAKTGDVTNQPAAEDTPTFGIYDFLKTGVQLGTAAIIIGISYALHKHHVQGQHADLPPPYVEGI